MKTSSLLSCLFLLVAAGVCLTGCFGFLKPSRVTTQYFVLSPLSAAASATPLDSAAPPLAVGVGFVKVPAYLFNKAVVYRKGSNEVAHLQNALWAERLDNGLQRIFAANLATLLPTDRIRLSAWRAEDISVEVYVSVEQFDVDSKGQGLLAAWWRVSSPSGEKVLKAGEFRVARQGPSPTADPQGAIATMSGLSDELSREIAQAIKDSGVRSPPIK